MKKKDRRYRLDRKRKLDYLAWDSSLVFWACIIIYLPVSRMALKVLQCRNVGHNRWVLEADPQITCFTSYHSVYMIFAILTILAVSIGMPVLFFLWLHRCARPLDKNAMKELELHFVNKV